METDQPKSSNSSSQQVDRSNSAIDIRQLRQIVMKQYKRNLDIYQRLKEDDVFIYFVLTAPHSMTGRLMKANSHEGERKQLMLLMDKLMVESDKLQKINRKNTFNQQLKLPIEDARSSIDAAFGFMRRVWTQDSSVDDHTDDKIDRLSKIVGSLKGNLQKVLGTERRKELSKKPIEDILLDVPSFVQLKQAYERLKMSKEDLNYTMQSKLKETTQKLREKQKVIQLLRQQNRDQKQKIKKLQNQTLLVQTKLQELTERVNKLSSQGGTTQKSRVKVVYTGNDFELSLKSSKLADIEKTFHACDRTLEQIRSLLEKNESATHQQSALQQVNNSSKFLYSSASQKVLSCKKSPSIQKMQSPGYHEQISNVRYSRTNNLVNSGLPPRKPSQEAGLQAKFYTKLDMIGKLQGAFTK